MLRDRHVERRSIEVAGLAVTIDECPVHQGIASIGGPDEGQGEVRTVGQVDREPVPAAPSDGDEVAPLWSNQALPSTCSVRPSRTIEPLARRSVRE